MQHSNRLRVPVSTVQRDQYGMGSMEPGVGGPRSGSRASHPGGPASTPPTASAFAWRLGFCDSPSRGSDTRVTNRGRRLHLRPGTWFTSCQAIGQGAWCRPQESLPPGGGVGERAKPAVEPEGGNSGLALLVHPSGKRDFFPSGGAWCWESNLADATWTAPPDRPNGRICRV